MFIVFVHIGCFVCVCMYVYVYSLFDAAEKRLQGSAAKMWFQYQFMPHQSHRCLQNSIAEIEMLSGLTWLSAQAALERLVCKYFPETL